MSAERTPGNDSAPAVPIVVIAPGERLLRRPEVSNMTGLQRTALFERGRKGTFPSAVDLGGGRKAWLQSQVLQWIAGLVPGAQVAGAPA